MLNQIGISRIYLTRHPVLPAEAFFDLRSEAKEVAKAGTQHPVLPAEAFFDLRSEAKEVAKAGNRHPAPYI